jgi:GNAT superfamily N-acetyltransferase
MVSVSSAVTLRPYRDEDETAVLDLLTASLGGGPAGTRPPEFFRWKHLENPFGRSYMLLAEAHGQIVGFRSFMRWRFDVSGASIRAVRAVDTATHPDYQGLGIFRRLTTTAIEELRSEADLIFNTPNDKSLPGYLKMGWRRVADMPIRVRVRRPIRFVRHVRSRHVLATSSAGTGPAEGIAIRDASWADAAALLRVGHERSMTTPRDETYLRWRYGNAPLLSYRVTEERRGTDLRGIVVYRVRRRGGLREATVSELFVRPDDRACASRLLRRVAREADVDHLTCSFPAGSVQAGAAWRSGFLPSPEGLTLVANPLRDMDVDVFSVASWSLSLGDLEVF